MRLAVFRGSADRANAASGMRGAVIERSGGARSGSGRRESQSARSGQARSAFASAVSPLRKGVADPVRQVLFHIQEPIRTQQRLTECRQCPLPRVRILHVSETGTTSSSQGWAAMAISQCIFEDTVGIGKDLVRFCHHRLSAFTGFTHAQCFDCCGLCAHSGSVRVLCVGGVRTTAEHHCNRQTTFKSFARH